MATIKGLFIKAHVDRIRAEKGEKFVYELEKLFGKSVSFSSFGKYPAEDEEFLLRCCVQVLYPNQKFEDINIAAGAFHFQTFVKNQIAKIVISIAGQDPRRMFVEYVPEIIKSVFEGVSLEVEATGERELKCYMRGSGAYPIRHWEGFWGEYFKQFGFIYSIESNVDDKGDYIYIVRWERR